ncbi:hypothetical protein PUN28_005367 [Cardiocondyla obscurior]|uniref:Uncharacterized protein n=1 Tax=Cardiocondyla obscurior TaxID=286306 RepID=A0AAW2GJF5_9HYME
MRTLEREYGKEDTHTRCWRCGGTPMTASTCRCRVLLVEPPGGRYPSQNGPVRRGTANSCRVEGRKRKRRKKNEVSLPRRNNLRRQLMRASKPCIAPIVSCLFSVGAHRKRGRKRDIPYTRSRART